MPALLITPRVEALGSFGVRLHEDVVSRRGQSCFEVLAVSFILALRQLALS
jgi:hypothetical protein